MTYFSDLSDYTYTPHSGRIRTRNVGWLSADHDFPTSESVVTLLTRLWPFCLLSVYPRRGLSHCPLCNKLGVVERNETRYVFGDGEIRVFDRHGQTAFAAPNLLYHYIEAHHYLPPPEFLDALQSGPQPQTQEYQALLDATGAEWFVTEPTPGLFRFVKRGNEVVRECVVEPKPKPKA